MCTIPAGTPRLVGAAPESLRLVLGLVITVEACNVAAAAVGPAAAAAAA